MKHYQDSLKFHIIVGGLRPFNTMAMTAMDREEVLHHWRQVHSMTGQAFQFEGVLTDGFIYDTEPACRAVVTLSQIDSNTGFGYFRALHEAFYTKQQDITQESVLATLAEKFGVEKQTFLQMFNSEVIKKKTQEDFQKSRHFGITGFPSIILEKSDRLSLLTAGYQGFEALQPVIDEWLSGDVPTPG